MGVAIIFQVTGLAYQVEINFFAHALIELDSFDLATVLFIPGELQHESYPLLSV